MSKTSYKNTKELISELTEKIDLLNSGQLSFSELDELVENGKDLYENLIILRYKAFDTIGTTPSPVEEEKVEEAPVYSAPEKTVPKKEVQPIEAEMSFDFTDLDSEKKEEQPSFDFSAPEATIKEVEKPKETPVSVAPTPPKEEVEAHPNSTDNHFVGEDENADSLNDALRDEEDLSLRKRLQNTPISDIKTKISIAKKFEYISNMFGGDSEAYDEAIDFLNTCATGNDAQLKLNEIATIRKWDLENKSILNFMELVERRYL